MVEMRVFGLTIDPQSKTPIVVLREASGDAVVESTELFQVNLSNASHNADITTGSANGSIVTDDLPELLMKQTVHFFEHYKDLEPGKWVKVLGWGTVEDAKQEILNGLAAAAK